MSKGKPYDESVTEQQREVQEALLSMPDFSLEEEDERADLSAER